MSDIDKTTGLRQRYSVIRLDGSSALGGKHENCDYFVLDLQHDAFAKAALRAYAAAARADFPNLAEDLTAKYGLNQ
jgi:hypothetical protein